MGEGFRWVHIGDDDNRRAHSAEIMEAVRQENERRAEELGISVEQYHGYLSEYGIGAQIAFSLMRRHCLDFDTALECWVQAMLVLDDRTTYFDQIRTGVRKVNPDVVITRVGYLFNPDEDPYIDWVK